MDGNDKLVSLLEKVLENSELRQQLGKELQLEQTPAKEE
jgi:predicted component of type VI protein secretion system